MSDPPSTLALLFFSSSASPFPPSYSTISSDETIGGLSSSSASDSDDTTRGVQVYAFSYTWFLPSPYHYLNLCQLKLHLLICILLSLVVSIFSSEDLFFFYEVHFSLAKDRTLVITLLFFTPKTLFFHISGLSLCQILSFFLFLSLLSFFRVLSHSNLF